MSITFFTQLKGKKSFMACKGVPTAKPIITSAQPGKPKDRQLEVTKLLFKPDKPSDLKC